MLDTTINNPEENNYTVYQLVTEDLQSIADTVIDRQLTKEEILTVKETVNNSIDWTDYVKCAILDCIEKD